MKRRSKQRQNVRVDPHSGFAPGTRAQAVVIGLEEHRAGRHLVGCHGEADDHQPLPRDYALEVKGCRMLLHSLRRVQPSLAWPTVSVCL